MNGLKIALIAGIVTSGIASSASARVTQDLLYTPDLTWNAAIRMIRVDMGFVITERDRESGFFLFTYRDNARSVAGSVELVPTTVDGMPAVRAIVQLPAMPTYAERHLLTRLDRKLHEEYGEPRRPARSPAPNAPRGSDPPRDPAANAPPTTPANGAEPRENDANAAPSTARSAEPRATPVQRSTPIEDRGAFVLGNDR
jgi:hypothetical protein